MARDPRPLEVRVHEMSDREIAQYCHGLIEAIAKKRNARKLLITAVLTLKTYCSYKVKNNETK